MNSLVYELLASIDEYVDGFESNESSNKNHFWMDDFCFFSPRNVWYFDTVVDDFTFFGRDKLGDESEICLVDRDDLVAEGKCESSECLIVESGCKFLSSGDTGDIS